MTDTITAGTFALDAATRTVRGLLVPWDEETRHDHAHPAVFRRGTIAIPRDLTILRANRLHSLLDPVGVFSSVEDTERGIEVVFRIADTDEGDELIQQHQAGLFTRLSAEFKGLVKKGKEVVSGTLVGAAFVPEGAFASAALFALDPITDEPEQQPEPDTQTPSEDTATEDNAAPAADQKEDAVADAIAPNTVADRSADADEPITAEAMFALIKEFASTGDTATLAKIAGEHADALFALTEVKVSGANQVGTGVIQPAWLGELWDGRSYQQQWIPEFNSGVLTSLELKGYHFTAKPTVAAWTGNKSDVPSPAVTTAGATGVLQRFAAGYDLAREFYDFPSAAEVRESFIRHLVNSFAKVSDKWLAAQLIAALTPEAADTYPAGVGDAWGKIIQGALNVIASDNVPSVAYLGSAVFNDFVYTREEDRLAFLDASLSLTGGSAAGFKVKPDITLGADQVLVAAKEAVRVFTLPGSPIRVNALDIARGGVDEAVFGYVGYIIEDLSGMSLVEDA